LEENMVRAKTINKKKPDIQLTISWGAARALRSVCIRIGGNAEDTARGYTDEIGRALEQIGVPLVPKDDGLPSAPAVQAKVNNSITFVPGTRDNSGE
jgi:hypothetical protein